MNRILLPITAAVLSSLFLFSHQLQGQTSGTNEINDVEAAVDEVLAERDSEEVISLQPESELNAGIGLEGVSLSESTEESGPLLTVEESADRKIVEEGAHHRTWETRVAVTNGQGRVRYTTNSYTELLSGLNYKGPGGAWNKSKAAIEVRANGIAIARQGAHVVAFAPNINSRAAVVIATPEQKKLRTHVLGVAYHDFKKKESVLISEVKNSTGVLVGSNQILYADAFTDIKADISYTYTRDGLEQDIIFRERLPLPETYNFDPRTTWIEVWTEFINPPEVEREQQVRKGWTKAKVDRILDFGEMQIGPGAAFGLGERGDKYKGIPVRKHWMEIEGRTFLVEEVSFRLAKPKMRHLPQPNQAGFKKEKNGNIGRISQQRLWPERKVASSTGTNRIEVASLVPSKEGFVLDYALLTSVSDFTFKGNITYYVEDTVNLSGTTTIEGGAVVKYTNGAAINILGTLNCLAEAYHPAVFTAYNDSSVGAYIQNTGPPSGTYAQVALSLANGGALKYVHFRYADIAVHSEADYSISHSQFIHCNSALQTEQATVTAENVLMYNVEKGFSGFHYQAHATHLTFNEGHYLTDDWYFEPEYCGTPASSSLYLTNSLITAPLYGLGVVPCYLTDSQYLTSNTGVYDTVGAAGHYLADGTYRNQGSTQLSASLLAALKKKTTAAPTVITSDITSDTILEPIVSRDTDVPDLGYHYDPLDYVIGHKTLSGANLTLTNGVAIGFYTTHEDSFGTFYLECGAHFVSEGSPFQMNHLVWYNTVQEQASSTWSALNKLEMFSYQRYDCAPVNLKTRFTVFSQLANSGAHIGMGDVGWKASLSFRDTQFRSSDVYFWSSLNAIDTLEVNLENCLFERCGLWSFKLEDSVSIRGFNNTFYGGMVSFGNATPNHDTAELNFQNNFFYGNPISQNPNNFTTTFGHNAYLTNHNRLLPHSSSDVILQIGAVGFVGNGYMVSQQSMPLGRFYQAGSGLINKGSVTAETLGLYHYTVQTTKEGVTTNDIGFHYVATSNGALLDYDGDGLPDYLEDANGNGLHDSNESDWQHGRPTIVVHPQGQTVAEGSAVTLSVTALGAQLSYQWYKDNNALAGATLSALVLQDSDVADSGDYKVTVSNSYGSAASDPATVVVLGAPVITTQPSSQSVNSGSTVVFSVEAEGIAPITYQWKRNGTTILDGGNVSGATTSALSLADVSINDAVEYSVSVTNPGGIVESETATLLVNGKKYQSITFQALADQTFGAEPVQLIASASSGLPVAIEVKSGPATIIGSMLVVNGPGVVSIEATQAGNAEFHAASPVTRSFSVSPNTKQDQSITFNSLSDRTFPSSPFSISASASSGLPIGFEIVSGPASIVGNTVTIQSTGVIRVRATQEGNDDYNPAPPVDRLFVARATGKTTQTITIDAPSSKVFGEPPFAISASATSGNAVTLVVLSGPASMGAGNVLTITGTGPVVLGAYQEGDQTYHPADAQKSISVVKAAQTIRFTQLPATAAYGDTFVPVAVASSGLPVTYSVGSRGRLTDSGVLVTAVGTVNVTATQAGNKNFKGASISSHVVGQKAILTVKAADAIRVYGAPNPPFGCSFVGLKNGDQPSVVSGKATFQTSATPGSPIGSYDIEVTGIGTLSANNYSINPDPATFVDGTLTIVKAHLNVSARNVVAPSAGDDPELKGKVIGFAGDGSGGVGPEGITDLFAGSPYFNLYHVVRPGSYSTPTKHVITRKEDGMGGAIGLLDPNGKLANYTVAYFDGALGEGAGFPFAFSRGSIVKYVRREDGELQDPGTFVGADAVLAHTTGFNWGNGAIEVSIVDAANPANEAYDNGDRIVILPDSSGLQVRDGVLFVDSVKAIGLIDEQKDGIGKALRINLSYQPPGESTPVPVTTNDIQRVMRQIAYSFSASVVPSQNRKIRVSWEGTELISKSLLVEEFECPTNIDLIFVVDQSRSVDAWNNTGRQASADFVSKFGIGSDRVGAVCFEGPAGVLQPLSSDLATVQETLRDKLLHVSQFAKILIGGQPQNDSGQSCGDVALGAALKEFERAGGNSEKIIVLLTDGDWIPRNGRLEIPQALKSQNIRIFALGLGKSYKEEVLKAVASSPADAIFPSDKENPNLAEMLSKVAQRLCRGDQPPSITLAETAEYIENASPTLLDAGASVSDNDSANFANGKLMVSIFQGGESSDRLIVRNQDGSNDGEISLIDSDGDGIQETVMFSVFEGTPGSVVKKSIGTFKGGNGEKPLEISLNVNCTLAAANALLPNLAYESVSENPSTTPRVVRVSLADGSGGISPVKEITINVVAVNDPPTLDPVPDQVVRAGSAQRTIQLTGIGSGPDGEAPLFVSLSVNDPTLFAPGGEPQLSYSSPDRAGTITFTPVATLEADKTAEIAITVQDSGGTSNGGSDEHAVTVKVMVTAADSFFVDAGQNQTLYVNELPVTVTLSGTSQNGVGNVNYIWGTKSKPVGGYAAFTRGETGASVDVLLNFENSSSATYIFELTGTDDEGQTARNSVQVQVIKLPISRTYTSSVDFEEGSLSNLNYDEEPDQLRINSRITPFPYINVACTERGTVARIDVNTGEIVGEYRTTPASKNFLVATGEGQETKSSPSRTTVDKFGNVWVANRGEDGSRDDKFRMPTMQNDWTGKGSVTRIGLVIGGTRGDKVLKSDGSYTVTPNPMGEYLAPPFKYNTCIDRDGDGLIRTSSGSRHILGWKDGGKIVVNSDSATLQTEHFNEDTRTLVKNILRYFAEGKSVETERFLIYSADAGLNAPEFIQQLKKGGEGDWEKNQIDIVTSAPGLETLRTYHAVFLGGLGLNNGDLVKYVKGGGNVYLAGGTGVSENCSDAADDAERWNSFLRVFGMEFDASCFKVPGLFTASSENFLAPRNFSEHVIDMVIEYDYGQLFFGRGNTLKLYSGPEGAESRQNHLVRFLESGPSAFWTAENTAEDLIGVNHATGSVTYSEEGYEGTKAFQFDGTDDHLTVAGALGNFEGDFTIDFWIKRQADGTVISKGDPTSEPGAWLITASTVGNDLKISFKVPGHGLTLEQDSYSGLPPVASACRIRITRVGNTYRLYVNDELKARNDVLTVWPLVSAGPLVFGAQSDASGTKSAYFAGLLDQLAIYKGETGLLATYMHSGGVELADDEAIINYVRTPGKKVRTIAIDGNNDVWVGGHGNRIYQKIDDETGMLVDGTQFPPLGYKGTFGALGAYGGLIDRNGILWSVRHADCSKDDLWGGLLRFDPSTSSDLWIADAGGETLNNAVWRNLGGIYAYGISIDPATQNIWYSESLNCSTPAQQVHVISPAGEAIGSYYHGYSDGRGLAVDDRGNVWVAHSPGSNPATVGHLRTDGTYVGNVVLPCADEPTGVSVDSNGYIWVTSVNSSKAVRINPNGGPVIGGHRLGYVDMVVDLGDTDLNEDPDQPYDQTLAPAGPYNYSDMTGFTSLGATEASGSWSVVHDGGVRPGELKGWKSVEWNATVPNADYPGDAVVVEARASDSQAGLSSAEFLRIQTSGSQIASYTSEGTVTGLAGRFIEVRVTLRQGLQQQGFTTVQVSPILEDLTITPLTPSGTLPNNPDAEIEIARADEVDVYQNSSSNALDVLKNDLRPPGASLKIIGATAPRQGGVVISPDGTRIHYTPRPGFEGIDHFVYSVLDQVSLNGTTQTGAGVSRALVTVTVSPMDLEVWAPIAKDDSFVANGYATHIYTESGGVVAPVAFQFDVLANDESYQPDSDPSDGEAGAEAVRDLDTKSLVAVSAAKHGLVKIQDGCSGNLVYTPTITGAISGAGDITDTFTYTVVNSKGVTDTASVTVRVKRPVEISCGAEIQGELASEDADFASYIVPAGGVMVRQPSGKVDVYKFYGFAGQKVRIKATVEPGGPSAVKPTFNLLCPEKFKEVGSPPVTVYEIVTPGSSDEDSAELEFQLPTTGTYHLEASTREDGGVYGTGAYAIKVDCGPLLVVTENEVDIQGELQFGAVPRTAFPIRKSLILKNVGGGSLTILAQPVWDISTSDFDFEWGPGVSVPVQLGPNEEETLIVEASPGPAAPATVTINPLGADNQFKISSTSNDEKYNGSTVRFIDDETLNGDTCAAQISGSGPYQIEIRINDGVTTAQTVINEINTHLYQHGFAAEGLDAVTGTMSFDYPEEFVLAGGRSLSVRRFLSISYKEDALGTAPQTYSIKCTATANEGGLVKILSPSPTDAYLPGSAVEVEVAAYAPFGATLTKVTGAMGSQYVEVTSGVAGETSWSGSLFLNDIAEFENFITIRAWDSNGADHVAYVMPSVRNGVQITAPANGTSYAPGTPITLVASVDAGPYSAIEEFKFKLQNGEVIYSTTSFSGATATVSYEWTQPILGEHFIVAEVKSHLVSDSTKTTTTESLPVSVSVLPAASVSITSPPDNYNATYPANLTIVATPNVAQDVHVRSVEFNSPDGSVTIPNSTIANSYDFRWSGIPKGKHKVIARATFAGAGITPYTIDSDPLTIFSGVGGVQMNPDLDLAGEPNADIHIGFSLTYASGWSFLESRLLHADTGVQIGDTLTAAPANNSGTLTWESAPAGKHRVKARVKFIHSNSGQVETVEADPVSIFVGDYVTVLPGVQPYLPGSDITLTAEASSSGTQLQFIDLATGNQIGGNAVPGASSTYTSTWSGAAAGKYQIFARVTFPDSSTLESDPISFFVGDIVKVNNTLDDNEEYPEAVDVYEAGVIDLPFAADVEAREGATVSSVVYLDYSTEIGYAKEPSFRLKANNLAIGTHTFAARAHVHYKKNPAFAWTTKWSDPVSVHVGPPLVDNNAPVAVDDLVSVKANVLQPGAQPPVCDPEDNACPKKGVAIHVLNNDQDADGDALKVASFTEITRFGKVKRSSTNPDVLVYVPGWNSQGTDSFVYTVEDAKGARAQGRVRVTVVAGEPPTVAITSVNGQSTGTGQIILEAPSSVSFSYSAIAADSGTISKTEFYSWNRKIGVVAGDSGTFVWNKAPRGEHQIVAVTYDASGYWAYSSPVHLVLTGVNGNLPPVAHFAEQSCVPSLEIIPVKVDGQDLPDPAAASPLPVIRNGSLKVFGGAYDPDSSESAYQILLTRADGTFVRNVTPSPDSDGYRAGEFGASNSNVEIADLDLTGYPNGVYNLELNVWDGSDLTTKTVRFVLRTQLKLGKFTFSEEDVAIPTAGMPLTIIRTYDSFNPDSGDFGYGWTYELNDLNVQFNEYREIATDFLDDESFSMRAGGGRDVTLTLPGGQETTFVYTLVKGPNNDGTPCYCWEAKWIAEPGITAKLTPKGDPTLKAIPGTYPFWQAAGAGTPMDNFDFPGFILEMPDGTKYHIDREYQGGHTVQSEPGKFIYARAYGDPSVTKIEAADGNRILIEEDRIENVDSAGNKTRAVVFVRDTAGRIKEVYDPANLDQHGQPNGVPLINYKYDDLGNLERVERLARKPASGPAVYEKTTYQYGDEDYPHLIKGILDHRNVPVAMNEYYPPEDVRNAGKLKTITASDGTETHFDHVYDNFDQMPDTGFTVAIAAQETIRIRHPGTTKDVVTVHQTDANGNVVFSKDALNGVAFRLYDPHNNVTLEHKYLSPTSTTPLTVTEYDRQYVMEGLKETSQVAEETVTQAYDPSTVSEGEKIKTKTVYDSLGRVYKTIDALNFGGTPNFWTEYTYNNASQLEKTEAKWANGTTQLISKSVYHQNIGNDQHPLAGYLHYTEDAAGTRTYTHYYGVVDGEEDDADESGGRFGDVERTLVKDVNGVELNRVEHEYDQNGNQTTEAKYRRKSFDDSTLLKEVSRYFYDAKGRVERVEDPLGGSSRTVYNEIGKVDFTEDKYGNRTVQTYDAKGEVIRTTRPHAGTTTSITRSVTFHTQDGDRVYRVSVSEEPHLENATTVYGTRTTYDEIGRVVLSERLKGISITELTDTYGEGEDTFSVKRLQFVGAQSVLSATRTFYDDHGRADHTQQTHYVGATPTDLPISTYNHYDGHGRRSRVETRVYNPAGTAVERYIQAFYRYNKGGNQTHFCTLEGQNAVAPSDPADPVWTIYHYDDFGRRHTTELPLLTGNANRYTLQTRYNLLGQRIEEIDQAGIGTAFEYDAAGRLINVTNVYRTATIEPSDIPSQRPANQTVTSYAYDESGNMIAQTDANGHVTKFEYDALGRRTKRILPGTQVETTSYDPVDTSDLDATDGIRRKHELTRTDFKQVAIRSVFDEAGRLKEKYVGGVLKESYTYTIEGKRDVVTDPSGTTDYSYDEFGRLDTKAVTIGGTPAFSYELSYTYDSQGNLETISSSRGGTKTSDYTYTWDNLNRLKEVYPTPAPQSLPSDITGYTYDNYGNLDTVSYPSSVSGESIVTDYTYDNLHRLTIVDIQKVGTANSQLAKFEYDLDLQATLGVETRLSPTGNRRSAVETINGAKRVARYTYDEMYRLTQEDISGDPAPTPGPSFGPTGSIIYDGQAGYDDVSGYDRVGNRRSRMVNLTDPVPNPRLAWFESKNYAYDVNDWLDSDAIPNNANANYDANGNTLWETLANDPDIVKPTLTSHDEYDYQNRLVRRSTGSISTTGNTVIEIVYDADGNRVKKIKQVNDGGTITTTTTCYVVDGLNPTGYMQVLEEWETTDTTWGNLPARSYQYGHDLIAQKRHDGTALGDSEFYGYDGHGNVRLLVQHDGSVLNTYTYDAFGTQIHQTGTAPNRYLYCGEQWDQELGFYYLRARYMNPDSGRFWTMDTYEGNSSDPLTLHKYLYCHVNPVNGTDPSGNAMTLTESLAVTTIGGILLIAAYPVIQKGVEGVYQANAIAIGNLMEQHLQTLDSAEIDLRSVDMSNVTISSLLVLRTEWKNFRNDRRFKKWKGRHYLEIEMPSLPWSKGERKLVREFVSGNVDVSVYRGGTAGRIIQFKYGAGAKGTTKMFLYRIDYLDYRENATKGEKIFYLEGKPRLFVHQHLKVFGADILDHAPLFQ